MGAPYIHPGHDVREMDMIGIASDPCCVRCGASLIDSPKVLQVPCAGIPFASTPAPETLADAYQATYALEGAIKPKPAPSNPFMTPSSVNTIAVDAVDLSVLSLPDDDAKRGEYPMADGLLDYFPNALAEVAKVSKIGNDQHNPGQPLNWARDKSTDHANKIMRHLVDRGRFDGRGVRHTARLAWRALAMLQTEIEQEEGYPQSRRSTGQAPIQADADRAA